MRRTPLQRLRAGRLGELGQVGIRTHLLEIAAKLDDVIAMGRGDPDLDTPQHIIDAAKKEARVLIFPGKLFADPSDRFVRISLLAPTARIHAAAERMQAFVANLTS